MLILALSISAVLIYGSVASSRIAKNADHIRSITLPALETAVTLIQTIQESNQQIFLAIDEGDPDFFLTLDKQAESFNLVVENIIEKGEAKTQSSHRK